MILKNNSIYKKITYIIFPVFFLIGIITYKDYGISVDEEFERRVGFYWLNDKLDSPLPITTKLKCINNFINIKFNWYNKI